jgi:hypothetical protein
MLLVLTAFSKFLPNFRVGYLDCIFHRGLVEYCCSIVLPPHQYVAYSIPFTALLLFETRHSTILTIKVSSKYERTFFLQSCGTALPENKGFIST